jgi:urea carboxylase-associated protein 2
MIDPDQKQARIAALRQRYEALRVRGQDLASFESRIAKAPRIDRETARRRAIVDRVIPAGWYWQGHVPAGTCLRIENDLGTPGVAALLWNAADASERLCVADTIKVQWTARLGRGRVLLSDMGRVLAAIVEDTCGRHDALLGAGFPRLDQTSSPLTRRNSHENLQLAAAKLRLGPRDVHAPLTFFAAVRLGVDQRIHWDASASFAGTYVDLHAEMGLLAALSNVPHPLAPAAFAAADVRVMLWRPESPDISRLCRQTSEEVERAFDHTRAYLAERTMYGNTRHA